MKPDEALQLLRDAEVDPEVITALEGSTLRKEISDLTKERDDLRDKVGKHRDATLAAKFEALNVKVKPDALKIPEDLDELDDTKVTEWLAGMGLVEAPPPSEEEEERNTDLETQQRITAAGAGAGGPAGNGAVLTPETVNEWPMDKLMRFRKQHPDEFEAIKRGEPVRNVQFT